MRNRSTQQQVYFVRSAKALYLSLGACKGPGLVPKDFPWHISPTVEAARSSDTPGREGCQVPPKPAEMSVSQLKKNVARLEERLLQYFSTTIFNTARSSLHNGGPTPPYPPYARRSFTYLPHSRIRPKILGG